MEKIKQIIDEFAQAEYQANKHKYDKEIDDAVRNNLNEAPKAYLHSILSFMNFGGHPTDLDWNLPDEILQMALNQEYQQRPLFQIRKYQNPECGEKTKSILKSNIIYCCYLGNDELDEDEPSSLSRNFYVAETDEGLKIVYYTLFNFDHWTPMNEWEPTMVKKTGKLLEAYNFDMPADEDSIKALKVN